MVRKKNGGRHEDDHQDCGDEDDHEHRVSPGGADLGDGHGDVEAHAVVEFEPDRLLGHSLKRVGEEPAAAVYEAVRNHGMVVFEPLVRVMRVADDVAVFVVDEGVAALV